MDNSKISKIQHLIWANIPEELYEIAPGQVVYFVPQDGLSQSSANQLTYFYQYMRQLRRDKDIHLSIIPTSYEILIDSFACRNPYEVAPKYKVVVSSWDTIAGFASQLFGEDVEKIVERVPKPRIESHISISATDLPVVVSIDPKERPNGSDCSVKDRCASCPYKDGDDGDYFTEVLQARPEPGSKEKKKLIEKEEKKLYSLLRECYVLDIELDIDKVRKKFEKAVNSNVDHQLIIKAAFHVDGIRHLCDYCDIYVADDKKYKLDLTAVEKAIYLTFLLYPQGIRVRETFWGFRETCMIIYGKLPLEERFETDEGFRLDKNPLRDVYESTLRGYLSTIRTKVAKKVSNPKTAIEFAIEGYKDQEFGIARSTPEIRAQIKDYFGL